MRYRIPVFFLIHIFFLIAFQAASQPAEYKMTQEEYIDRFREDAVKDMHLYGIPASITLAQAMLESDNGNSALAVYANNHFGIKCHNDWKGDTYVQDDDKKNECFRKYRSVGDSYDDHSEFLKTRKRYEFLFKLKPTDYRGWAKGLKEAGYATDPKYPGKLIDLIERHKLYEYDRVKSFSKIPAKSPVTKGKVKPSAHPLQVHNHIKSIIIQEGDNLLSLSNELEIEIWQLLKYNDLSKSDKLVPGERLYLQPKKRKAKQEFHPVQEGETMRLISQHYGVKMKMLYRYNDMKPGMEPKAGQRIYLKKVRR